MSRTGNCLDNTMAGASFEHLKAELLYNQTFKLVDHFNNGLHEYIRYYNEDYDHSNSLTKHRLNSGWRSPKFCLDYVQHYESVPMKTIFWRNSGSTMTRFPALTSRVLLASVLDGFRNYYNY